jgi:hypothetical protein
MRCLVSEACDDGIACTVDVCAVGGVCEHAPQDALCPTGQSCDRTRGCVTGSACTSSAECDDGVACTADACAIGGRCEHRPLDALCTGAGETCDPLRGCVRTGCVGDVDCDDGVACTVDTCAVGGRCENVPVNARCPMGQVCGRSGCFEMRPCTTNAECQNGTFCDGEELCDPEFGCQPAPASRNCDDRNPCTVDACDPAADMCVYTCTDAPAGCPMCPSAPPDYNGTYAIFPAPRQTCAFGMVNYDISSVRFTFAGGILQIMAGPFTLSQPGPTSGTGPTADGRFDASYEITGGCTERYRLEGAFMGPDRFTATWTATYVSTDGFSCALGGCRDQTISVTGTRTGP